MLAIAVIPVLFWVGLLPIWVLMPAGFICAGPVAHVTLALNAPLEVIIPIFLLSGFAAGFLNPIIGAILFERIAPAMVGRVIALVGALAWVLMPFGGLYGGVLVEWAGFILRWASRARSIWWRRCRQH